MKNFSMTLKRHSTASPEAIYDVLADLRTHLTWGGAQQRFGFRLLSLDAPAGPATAGTSFTSTGAIPMSPRHFEDRSAVTLAVRPSRFEFVTYATAHGARGSMRATYAHRYEIVATPGGSVVTYTLTQLDIANPILRMALPVITNMLWRVGIPFMAGRGVRNLVATAEQQAASHTAVRQLT